jgi:hypothetical protein
VNTTAGTENQASPRESRSDDVTYRFGFSIAVATVGLTVLTFALALTAIPNDVPYPFTSEEIADQWPGDYLWMYPAMLLMLLFVALVAAIHEYAPPARKLFTLLARSPSPSSLPPFC